jgi:hypothetical protein
VVVHVVAEAEARTWSDMAGGGVHGVVASSSCGQTSLPAPWWSPLFDILGFGSLLPHLDGVQYLRPGDASILSRSQVRHLHPRHPRRPPRPRPFAEALSRANEQAGSLAHCFRGTGVHGVSRLGARSMAPVAVGGGDIRRELQGFGKRSSPCTGPHTRAGDLSEGG